MDKPGRHFGSSPRASLLLALNRVIQLGKIAGLKIGLKATVFPAFVILWLILAVVGIWALKLPPLAAILGSLFAAILHYFSELWHQFGHSIASRMTGHPMTGFQFGGFLGTSLYPPKEKGVTPAAHIRRATGGPVASLLLMAIAGILSLGLSSVGGTLMWIVIFLFLDNLLVFTLGALLPTNFTDGGTILRWRKKL